MLWVLLAALLLQTLALSLWHQSTVEKQRHQASIHWQLQLQELQSLQRIWLREKMNDVMMQLFSQTNMTAVNQQLSHFQLDHPSVRSVRIEPVKADKSLSSEANCQPFSRPASTGDQQASAQLKSMDGFLVCRLNQQILLGLAQRLTLANQVYEVLIQIDYFGFLEDFKQINGIPLLMATTLNNAVILYEQPASGVSGVATSQVEIEFVHDETRLGLLRLSVESPGFMSLWAGQMLWLAPLTLLLLVLLPYLLLHRYLISPLTGFNREVGKLVREVHPDAGGFNKKDDRLRLDFVSLHENMQRLYSANKLDLLTGLINRSIFEERLQQAVLEGKRSGRKYALVLIDVNNFQQIDEQFGKYIADGLLKQLADRMTRRLRETDTLGRMRDDDFALLLEFNEDDQVAMLVEQLYHELSSSYEVYGRNLQVKVSMGVALYPQHGLTATVLENNALLAMRRAQQGKWPIEFCGSDEHDLEQKHFSMLQKLRHALEHEEFTLVYQPVNRLADFRTSYFEALLRWKQPEKHAQSIEQMIQLAERNQLIAPLTRWIIETACKQLLRLSDSHVSIAVNLSMIDLHDGELASKIGEILELYRLPANRLMVEITEGQIMKTPDLVIKTLQQLKQMGIGLSIDDFGTGQASMTYLKKMPVEKLKIDQSFVKQMVEDEEDRAIVESTVKLAHQLKVEVVAEGVESQAILELLKEIGCDYVQGYYLSRPMRAEKLDDWLAHEADAAGFPPQGQAQ